MVTLLLYLLIIVIIIIILTPFLLNEEWAEVSKGLLLTG